MTTTTTAHDHASERRMIVLIDKEIEEARRGGQKSTRPLPGTSEGGKGEKAPEVAGPSVPPESAPGKKAAEWTVVARRKKKAAARSTGEVKRGETKPTAAPSGGGSGGVPEKGTSSTAPPARQGGKAARKTKHLIPTEGEERSAAGGELPVAVTRQGTASGSIGGRGRCRRAFRRVHTYRPHGGGPRGDERGPPKTKATASASPLYRL
ncbi:UNVERIFIED_CONTAM: hypothetical protein FKN15_067107 [Acipenser sinensis]